MCDPEFARYMEMFTYKHVSGSLGEYRMFCYYQK